VPIGEQVLVEATALDAGERRPHWGLTKVSGMT